MNIKRVTAQTTDEQILVQTGRVRAQIAALAAEGKGSAEDFAGLTNALAEAEGHAFACGIVRDALIGEATPEQVMASLTKRLLNGADDGWSGRKNDARRAWFDGYRAAVNEYLWGF